MEQYNEDNLKQIIFKLVRKIELVEEEKNTIEEIISDKIE